MKIVYCIPSTANSGGMERVLSIKANYLAEKMGFDVSIVTTDQKGRESFFSFSNRITFYDLGINYLDNKINLNPIKLIKRFRLIKKHQKSLASILLTLKPDITISMFQHECSFLPNIKDGSKKIIESHFARSYRLLSSKGTVNKQLAKIRLFKDNHIIKKYDAFVTLTQEDAEDWPKYRNIKVIPNPITIQHDGKNTLLNNNRVLAVGRFTPQKGYDRLIEVWKYIESQNLGWHLHIIGAQDNTQYMQYIKNLIKLYNLSNVHIESPTNNIEEEYLRSDVLVMTSIYEGLPLALLEGMSKGLPSVAFACKCGPRDMIEDGVTGFLIKDGDIPLFSTRLQTMIEDRDMLKRMSIAAIEKSKKYSINSIMEEWIMLFNDILGNCVKR